METYDVIVIGGGPAGLSAAILLGRARRKVVVIDSGSPRNERAAHVNGFLGLPGISPAALRASGEQQARAVGVHFMDGLVVDASSKLGSQSDAVPTVFQVRLEDGGELIGRKLVFATGIRDELPQIPGFNECYGRSVHHCPYCDGWEHRDTRLVAFVESSESAIPRAETVLRWSASVSLVTHGNDLSDEDKAQLPKLGVRLHESKVVSLEHEAGTLQALVFTSGERLEADAVFFSAKSGPCCSLPQKLGCRSKEKRHVETTDRQGTGVPGVFLAGDADGDVQFAIVAAAEGAIAGMAVNKELQYEDLEALTLER
jgi:thioredoxin reductase